jgi:hypothetical protein
MMRAPRPSPRHQLVNEVDAVGHLHQLVRLTRRRYADGVSPQNWLKHRVKELRFSNPTADDVACTDCPGSASNAMARIMRACRR